MHFSRRVHKSLRHHIRQPGNSASLGNKSRIEFETERERKTGKMSDSPSPSTSKTETPGATGMGAGKEENKGEFMVLLWIEPYVRAPNEQIEFSTTNFLI